MTKIDTKKLGINEEELCPECFKVVGSPSRYKLVCFLGRKNEGATVTEITEKLKLTQPTISHHLSVLKTINAVTCEERGKERVYRLNENAHCFEECKIPFDVK